MRNGYLQSKEGEKITWLEATLRAAKGIGHPTSVKKIGDYMIDNVIVSFPETAKTPYQTIYREIYTHSLDSTYWRKCEHLFYTTGHGKWGLVNPDEWKKHQTVKKCDPFVLKALKNRSLLKSTEMHNCCNRLLGKEKEWELLFGEIMLITAAEKMNYKSRKYFNCSWTCARYLESILDLYIWEITDERVQKILANLPTQKKRMAERWIKEARNSKYNTKPKEQDYRLIKKESKKSAPSMRREFLQNISFPEGYSLPPRARFSTVFKFYLWTHKDVYSELYVTGTLLVSYNKLKSLHDRPYCLVRPDDIQECMSGMKKSSKNAIINLYRKLDGFAYEKDLITRRYATEMHYIRNSRTSQVNEFSLNEIECLCQHAGEVDVDVTLVLLYTGLGPRELCHLSYEDMDDQYVYIPEGRSIRYGRKIPIHPIIERPLRHALQYFESLDVCNTSDRRQREGVYRMVLAATQRYCANSHLPSQCRRSFETRLRESGASNGVIFYLLGTKAHDLSRYQYAYVHPRSEQIIQAIHDMK